MDSKSYRDLLPLVNDGDSYGRLQAYAEARVEDLRTFLEKENDVDKIKKLQGAIAELRRMATLREEVIREAKNGRG